MGNSVRTEIASARVEAKCFDFRNSGPNFLCQSKKKENRYQEIKTREICIHVCIKSYRHYIFSPPISMESEIMLLNYFSDLECIDGISFKKIMKIVFFFLNNNEPKCGRNYYYE